MHWGSWNGDGNRSIYRCSHCRCAKNNEGEIEVGSLVAVLATIEMLFSRPLCGRFIMMTQVAIASANRVFSFLDKRVANSNVERAMGMTLTNVSFQEMMKKMQNL